MQTIVNEEIAEKTTLYSKHIPISVASTIKSKDGITTIYFDIRTPNFINVWLSELFKHAKRIAKYNIFQPDVVNVIGYNSAKYDLNILFRELASEEWSISPPLGSSTAFKQLIISKKEGKSCISLRFIDAMLLSAQGSLRDFIKAFGTNKDLQKGEFPYDALTVENYEEVLSKPFPFTKKSFNNMMKNSKISDADYLAYVKDSVNFKTRWDYLQHYNELDTQAMISPLDNLIEIYWEYKIDCLKSLSLSSNASSLKYALAYRDFDINKDYSFTSKEPEFKMTKEWFSEKCKEYLEQDEDAERDTSENITVDDFDYFNKLYIEQKCKCCICYEKLTEKTKPSFDRIDNRKSHTRKNLQIVCLYCNVSRSKRTIMETKLTRQLTKFCSLKGLPTTINNERVYDYLRKGITGGLSNVHHRINIAGKTKINHLWYANQRVYSKDSQHIMTHFLGLDFNSLYPSSFSSNENSNIPYTNHKMYMPGRLIKEFLTVSEAEKAEARKIIMSKNNLFIVALKGHIDENYINEFINMPPIIRNVNITTNEQTIGSYMYNYMKSHKLSVDRKEKKLTQLLRVDTFTTFSSYYLWFLIDRCHFIIDDIEWISVWSKHDGFNLFVNELMNKRIKAMVDGNKGLENFCKTNLNGSYGYDAKNTEKYTKSSIKNRIDTALAQVYPSFVDTRKLNDDQYLVIQKPRTYRCDTCLQEAFFTLDNAKYWYLNFYYNFMVKCLDMEKIHFIEGDTDSMYFAIAGNPDEDYTQGFKYVIRDKEFYEKHVYEWFPKPNDDKFLAIKDTKKIYGLCVENQGIEMIALAPKCYTINKVKEVKCKLKGVQQSQNKLKIDDYQKAIMSVIPGKNVNFQLDRRGDDYQMSTKIIRKNALTGSHTKMVVLENQACCPFGFSEYIIDN